jgi:hypothetical protein
MYYMARGYAAALELEFHLGMPFLPIYHGARTMSDQLTL